MFSSGSQTEFIVDSEECAQGQKHGSKPGISLQFDGHWDPSPASALTGQLGKRTCFILKECQPVLNTFCYGQSKIVANSSVTLFYVHLALYPLFQWCSLSCTGRKHTNSLYTTLIQVCISY